MSAKFCSPVAYDAKITISSALYQVVQQSILFFKTALFQHEDHLCKY